MKVIQLITRKRKILIKYTECNDGNIYIVVHQHPSIGAVCVSSCLPFFASVGPGNIGRNTVKWHLN